MNFVDPNGEFGVFGAVLGAVTGVIGAISQGKTDTGSIAVAALVGAGQGLFGGNIFKGVKILGNVIKGSILGAGGDISGQLITRGPCDSINKMSVIRSGISGAIGGAFSIATGPTKLGQVAAASLGGPFSIAIGAIGSN